MHTQARGQLCVLQTAALSTSHRHPCILHARLHNRCSTDTSAGRGPEGLSDGSSTHAPGLGHSEGRVIYESRGAVTVSRGRPQTNIIVIHHAAAPPPPPPPPPQRHLAAAAAAATATAAGVAAGVYLQHKLGRGSAAKRADGKHASVMRL